MAREAAVSDPEVVELLKTRFISVAVDNVEHPNMTPDERQFLDGFESGVKACTIGMSAFTADGKKLASGGAFEPEGVRRMLKKALIDFKPETVSATVPPRDPALVRRSPEGGLVLYVTWKVLGDVDPESSATTGDGKYDKVFKAALGSDRLWVRKDEAEALAAGTLPDSLKARMLRYHVTYVMGKDVKELPIALREGRITGSFDVAGAGRVEAQGFVEAKGGKVTRFELVLKGWGRRVEDHGFAAGLLVVPKGKTVPAAIQFELADPSEGLAQVLPHRSKDEKYLK